mmetsp:Transcript_22955/g.65036  ORF Transcript_22955/g.65036 Transcript_22955/m.65036 type:complete len:507 (+) Transcript_22955:90-1610(+)
MEPKQQQTKTPATDDGGAAAATAAAKPMLECDYDVCASPLYQAIEAKEWEYIEKIFKAPGADTQAATWVFRKETNGQLRWRLLPIHAAIIFGAPLKLIELLLGEYPQGAQCKDDQGMLPLHLCFRNEASWEIIEEIITAYPEAYYVKDRKGRTPMSCGVRGIGSSAQSVSSQSQRAASGPKSSFKCAISVLEIMTDVAVNAEMQKVREESRTILESRVAQLQDAHLQTLTQLKKEWHKQRDESKRGNNEMQEEIESLREQLAVVEAENADLKITEGRLTDRLEDLTAEFNLATAEAEYDKRRFVEEKQTLQDRIDLYEAVDEKSGGTTRAPATPLAVPAAPAPLPVSVSAGGAKGRKMIEQLRATVHTMVEDKKEYHVKFGQLVSKYEGLALERKRIMEVFGQQSQDQFNKELDLVQGFQDWMEEKLVEVNNTVEVLDEEEKKDDNLLDYDEQRFIDGEAPGKTVMMATSMELNDDTNLAMYALDSDAVDTNVIDLSSAPSPKHDP